MNMTSLPSRADVIGNLLNEVYESKTEQCTESKGEIISLSLDGWSHVHNDTIVGICVTTEKGLSSLETTEMSVNPHIAFTATSCQNSAM